MKNEILSHFPFISLTILALIIFMLVFICMLFWVHRKESNSLYERLSQLPLEGSKS